MPITKIPTSLGVLEKPKNILTTPFLTVVFLGAMFILLGNTFVLYRNMEIVRAHQQEIERSNRFLEELEVTISNLKDIETGQRGFALTSNETFLAPYYSGLQSVFEHLRHLKQTKRPGLELQERLQLLEQKTQESIAFQESVISLVRQNKLALAREAVASGRGKVIMDSMRQVVDEIRDVEKDALAKSSVDAEQSSLRVDRLFLFVGATILVLGTLCYLLLYRSLTRQAAETERLKHETWIKSGLADLNERLRGMQTVEGIGQKTLDFFSQFVEAQFGLFYMLRGQSLDAIAQLAPTQLDLRARKNLSIGETLAGDAFRQQKVMRLTQIPEGYLRIGSGLGEAKLAELLLVPISFEDQPIGVLEIGSLNSFDELDRDLIERAMPGIGIGLSAAQSRLALQDLLEETQRQSEELQAQQEELRISNEELENQAETLRSSQDKLQQQQEELRQINEELEQQAHALEAQTALLNGRNQVLEEIKIELEQKATALENASRYKSEFLANMSHELRTPLNSLLILSTLLAENKDGNLTAKQVDFARTIYKSGNDLLALINDILDLSKVEAGKLLLQPEDFDLEGLAQDLQREFEHVAHDKGLNFIIERDANIPLSIRSDKQRVEQIIKNLLSNAIKFTSRGRVRLHMSYREGSESPLALTVEDTGIGIPTDKQDLIFEAFEQVDRSTSRAYGGTGLGLTISRELAQLLGGHITLESQAGEGSRFTLHLPLAIPEAVDLKRKLIQKKIEDLPQLKFPRAVPPPAPFAMEKDDVKPGDRVVLIVEDDDAFAKSLVEIAHEAGFKTYRCSSGEAALEATQQQNFSAILLDIKLPDISGFGVLERLKAQQRTRHIPIHVISGVDYSRNALSLGAVGYLLKPAAKSELEGVFKHLEELISRQVKKVLVVEDDVIQREAINHLLAGNDIELIGASSAAEALQRLSENVFDCMILDLRLPDLTGFQLLEKLEANQEISRPPVVVYTGQDLSQDDIEKLRQYSDSIVIKGVRSPERLFDEVSLFLHRVETQLPPDSQALLEKLRSSDDPLMGRRILVVDDDMRNVFAMANALSTHGMKVIVAKNGQEALDKLDQDSSIELVLMDIMMPIMDGYEAMSRLRELPRLRRLPVIALTAKAMKGDHEKCLKAGANDYLPKPVNLERLLSLMRVWLPRRHEV